MKVTEQSSNYNKLDKMSVKELLENINREDQHVALAVKECIPQIEKLVEGIVERMKKGGRLFYLGAGTSGRLGILDASEIPPTYGAPYDLVIGLIAGGDTALVDGVRGGWTYADGRWQGFINRDVDVVIDLGEPTRIRYIGAEFMQLTGPWLWQPEEVIISVSDDGESFTELSRQFTDVPKDATELIFRTYSWSGDTDARYVRYTALSNGIDNGCLFTDEIIIR